MPPARLRVTLALAAAAFSWLGCRGDHGDRVSPDSAARDGGAPRSSGSVSASASSSAGASSGASGASASAASAPRPGMAWIPAGTFIAGTPLDRTPRIADEEVPGVSIAMRGYYIDLLPYPNEPGAIATTNVPRAEAERLCVARGKRLCSELEWERACKGAQNTTYEYGDDYRAATCGTGVPASVSAKEPTGDHIGCMSSFGVRDMHGGAWEWTSSTWARGTTDPELGVLRGGNAGAGELVGRCANAIGRAATKKDPTMGLRCCAGPTNDAVVDLAITPRIPIDRTGRGAELAEGLAPLVKTPWMKAHRDGMPSFDRAWVWHPVANDELVIAGGCAFLTEGIKCGAIVGRLGATPKILAVVDTGLDYPTVATLLDARHVRMRGLEPRGAFVHDVTYAYGLVDVGPQKSP